MFTTEGQENQVVWHMVTQFRCQLQKRRWKHCHTTTTKIIFLFRIYRSVRYIADPGQVKLSYRQSPDSECSKFLCTTLIQQFGLLTDLSSAPYRHIPSSRKGPGPARRKSRQKTHNRAHAFDERWSTGEKKIRTESRILSMSVGSR